MCYRVCYETKECSPKGSIVLEHWVHPIEYVTRYATKEAADAAAEDSDEDEDEGSEIISDLSDDDDAPGMEL